jgi:hypothetical protein
MSLKPTSTYCKIIKARCVLIVEDFVEVNFGYLPAMD